MLSEVVLPRMEDADDEDKALAERLFAEVEQAGAPVTIALPALLHIKPDLRDEVVRKVADDVTSGNRGCARAAAHGIYLWTEHARQGGIAPPPGHLLDKLINRSLSRNPAALDSVLSGLRDLLHTTRRYSANGNLTPSAPPWRIFSKTLNFTHTAPQIEKANYPHRC